MNTKFKNFVNKAAMNKLEFDNSISIVRSNLQNTINKPIAPISQMPATTGWLKGSLSYPWVIACILIPSLKELI